MSETAGLSVWICKLQAAKNRVAVDAHVTAEWQRVCQREESLSAVSEEVGWVVCGCRHDPFLVVLSAQALAGGIFLRLENDEREKKPFWVIALCMYLIKMNRSCIFVSSSEDYSRRMCTHTRIYNQPKQQGFVSQKAARTRKMVGVLFWKNEMSWG